MPIVVGAWIEWMDVDLAYILAAVPGCPTTQK